MKLFSEYTEAELYNHKKGQRIMTDMLREFDRICRNYDLKYWCVGGTLIGAIRHKGWIPHDSDIDVGMLDSDYKFFREIVQKELSSHYWFQDRISDKNYKSNTGKIRYLYAQYDDYKCENWHNGLQIDIFIFSEKDNILKAPYEGNGDIKSLDKDIIMPIKELYFDNILVYVPNNYEKYSRISWGSYPPKILPLDKQRSNEGRISFEIPDWMFNKYSELYIENVKYINYKNIKILFPNEKQLNMPGEQVWVNYTGLTTERPSKIFNEISSVINIQPDMLPNNLKTYLKLFKKM